MTATTLATNNAFLRTAIFTRSRLGVERLQARRRMRRIEKRRERGGWNELPIRERQSSKGGLCVFCLFFYKWKYMIIFTFIGGGKFWLKNCTNEWVVMSRDISSFVVEITSRFQIKNKRSFYTSDHETYPAKAGDRISVNVWNTESATHINTYIHKKQSHTNYKNNIEQAGSTYSFEMFLKKQLLPTLNKQASKKAGR